MGRSCCSSLTYKARANGPPGGLAVGGNMFFTRVIDHPGDAATKLNSGDPQRLAGASISAEYVSPAIKLKVTVKYTVYLFMLFCVFKGSLTWLKAQTKLLV